MSCGDSFCYKCYKSKCCCRDGKQGPRGPQGPPGPPGRRGPQGPPGIFSPVYGNIFDNADQTLMQNGLVRFNQFNLPGSILVGGVIATNNSLTVPTYGDYAVSWQVSFLPLPGQQHAAFGIVVNGTTLINSTRSGVAAFADQELGIVEATSIVTLNPGDMLTLQLLLPTTSTQTAVNLSAQVQYPPFGGLANQPINSASLRIFKLGPI